MTKIIYEVDTVEDPYGASAMGQALNTYGALIQLDRTLRDYIKYREEDSSTEGMELARKTLYTILKEYNVNIID